MRMASFLSSGVFGFFDGARDRASEFISSSRIVVGTISSMVDMDFFRSRGESPLKGQADKTQYLITVPGMFNSEESSKEFLDQLQDNFPELDSIGNAGHVVNAGTIPGFSEMVQTAFLEMGVEGTPSATVAEYITAAYNDAASQGVTDPVIYVVAHSQGAAVVHQAKPRISPEIRSHVRVLTMGGEQFPSAKDWGYVANYDGERVPNLSPRNWVENFTGRNNINMDVSHGRKYYIDYLKANGLGDFYVGP